MAVYKVKRFIEKPSKANAERMLRGLPPVSGPDEVMNMEEFQERVVTEKRELDEKLARLRAFIGSERLAGVAEAERSRLNRQFIAMTKYSDILGERIAAF